MMDRRRFLLTSVAGALAWPFAAEAQQAGKVYRIGVLGLNATDPIEARQWQAFRLGLRERGWIEGGNILIEHAGLRAISRGSLNSRSTWFGSR